MFQELKVLLGRYFKTYFRGQRRLLKDYALIVFVGFLAITRNTVFGELGTWFFLLLLPFTFMAPMWSMLSEVVEEKSKGIKGYLKLNGLGTYTYQTYLISVFGLRTLIPS